MWKIWDCVYKWLPLNFFLFFPTFSFPPFGFEWEAIVHFYGTQKQNMKNEKKDGIVNGFFSFSIVLLVGDRQLKNENKKSDNKTETMIQEKTSNDIIAGNGHMNGYFWKNIYIVFFFQTLHVYPLILDTIIEWFIL